MSHPRHEILSAYTEGAMAVPRRLLVEAHLSKCPTCSIRAAEDHGLESLPDATLRDVLEAPSQRTNDPSKLCVASGFAVSRAPSFFPRPPASRGSPGSCPRRRRRSRLRARRRRVLDRGGTASGA